MTCFGTFIVFLSLAGLSCVSSQDLCQQGDNVVRHSSYKDLGEHRCCQKIRCEPGTEPVICDASNPYSTRCRPCPEDTFQPEFTSSVDMKSCQFKQSCREGMKVENDLSAVKDRECICDLEHGLCNSSRSRSQFCQLGNCSFGTELNPNCSCSECNRGFFKDTNGSSRCRKWRNCDEEGMTTLADGSTSTNRVCGPPLEVQPDDGTPKNETKSRNAESVATNSSNPTSSLEPFTTPDSTDGTESTGTADADNTKWIAVGIAIFFIVTVGLACAGLLIRRHIWKDQKTPRTMCESGQNQTPAVADDPLLGGPENQPNPAGRLPNQEILYERLLDQSPSPGGHSSHERLEQNGTQVLHQPRTENNPTNDRNTSCSDDSMNRIRERLNRCRPSIVEILQICPYFLSLLTSNDSITGYMKEIIDAEDRRDMKVDRLMDFLPKRPLPYAFETFVLSLVHTKQQHLARELDAELTEKFEEDLDQPNANINQMLQSLRYS